ncbi:EAL domain-containing protein [Marinimicrobium sp. ABcell2]|uniref:EAL domain-containing protein n=1 Tax=Marinimicrobium sp. ABcell2 TaxID=3069751 RepID=UPI0027B644B6|nr:EAL domain-containing protein [Marinimicrobium sp. ABcell2]MDQ2075884.1 EAL domain-containing protein [Marinimicrobium sp. ABcell2]
MLRHSLQLHEFLRHEHEAILAEWESMDRRLLESADGLSQKDLRNNIPGILKNLADVAEKAQGDPSKVKISSDGPEGHAQYRWSQRFSLEEVTREYAFLRTVILQKLVPRVGELSSGELVLVNEALDQAIVQSVITFVAKANSELKAEREQLQVTLRSIGDAVVSTDVNGRITYFNPAAERVTGWSQEEALGQPVGDVLITVQELSSRASQTLNSDRELAGNEAEVLLKRRTGELLPVEELTAPLCNDKGEGLGAVTTVRDMSTIRALTSELTYQASHDPLTGLPNRALLYAELEKALVIAEREKGRLALLYLDLDMFKDVNDMLGHTVGDELLRQVAKRLQHSVRRTDTVSRLGGDEFAILLTGFEPLKYLGDVSLKVARHLRAPFVLGQDTIDVSVSIGVSVYPEDGRDADTLVKHADVAMYQAKACGRDNIQYFAQEMNERAIERFHLEADLRRAIAEHQLSLCFQPQIALNSGRIIGAEALLRWKHPQKGLIPPDRFIPVAEQSGHLMMSIGDWVLEEACRQAKAWSDGGQAPIRISVNVSMTQLRSDRFQKRVEQLLHQYHMSPDQLQLELTESIIMSDVAGAKDHIRALKELGVRIAVDDFGTGYSSLSYLKDLPVDELKIDQSFVHDISLDANKAAIVQAVIRMGQSLKLRVIAEGVEDQAAVDFLTSNDCEAAQGYYYSKPITAAAFETWANQSHAQHVSSVGLTGSTLSNTRN